MNKTKRIALYFVVSVSLLTEIPAQADAPKRYLMAIFGDSISAGSLAQTKLKRDKMRGFLATIRENMQEVSEAAREVETHHIPYYENKTTLSWGSGENVPSHYTKLKLWFWKHDPSITLTVKNYAVPGVTTDDLVHQFARLQLDLKTGKYDELVYVGLTIGANDACSAETYHKNVVYEGLPNTRYRANLEKFIEGFSTIRQTMPIRILFQSIGKIADLGFPEILNYRSSESELTCRFARKHIFTYCPILPFWKNEAEYKLFSDIVFDKNEIMKSVIHESNQKYPNVHSFYSSTLYDTNIRLDILAIDCFHPDQHAQELLAEESFEQQPWFRFSSHPSSALTSAPFGS